MAHAQQPAATVFRDDTEIVEGVLNRDQGAFEALMRRHNTRLFRVARAILRDDAAAEDAVQDAYLVAYRHLSEFRADAQLGTWLVRIVANHALMRLRKQKRDRVVVPSRPFVMDLRKPTKWKSLTTVRSLRHQRRCGPKCAGFWNDGSTSFRWHSGRSSSCGKSKK